MMVQALPGLLLLMDLGSSEGLRRTGGTGRTVACTSGPAPLPGLQTSSFIVRVESGISVHCISEVTGDDGEILLANTPIEARLRFSNEYGWEGDVAAFGIVEFGETEESCVDAIRASIAFRWAEYALADAEELDDEARGIAEALRRTFSDFRDASASA